MDTITFRNLEITDTQQLLDFANALSIENTFVQLSGETISKKQENAYVKKSMVQAKNKNGVYIVGFCDGKLVANGSIVRQERRSRHVGELHIAVAKEFRQKGIGKAMIRDLLKKAKHTLGLRMVVLYCFETNNVALKLYEKVGFKKAGVIPGMLSHNGEYVGQVTMYAPLV